MPWPVGGTVAVRTFGNRRGTILAVEKGGRYRVRVDGVTMWCREEDLAAVDAGKKRKKGAGRQREHDDHGGAAVGAHGAPVRGDPTDRRSGGCRVDLHGLRVDEALSRVDEEINRALLNDADRLEVVHGLGTGRIRDALHTHLATLGVVAAFRLDPRNPGVTWVYF